MKAVRLICIEDFALPELPEVETTRMGILPHIKNHRVSRVTIRQARLRWPITAELEKGITGQKIESVGRRGKYLLLFTKTGTLLIHLGMSGSLRIVKKDRPIAKHDHVDIEFDNQKILRYTDPRRFGCMLWDTADIEKNSLLSALGPEPLSTEFDGAHLLKLSYSKKAPVKTFIMDSKIVVGVGNIYANEALFHAGISPIRKAGNISRERYLILGQCIKKTLEEAIAVGGTTLRDFTNSDGEPGYFKQSLHVYGRGGEACTKCESKLKEVRLGQRSTVYCTHCQK